MARFSDRRGHPPLGSKAITSEMKIGSSGATPVNVEVGNFWVEASRGNLQTQGSNGATALKALRSVSVWERCFRSTLA